MPLAEPCFEAPFELVEDALLHVFVLKDRCQYMNPPILLLCTDAVLEFLGRIDDGLCIFPQLVFAWHIMTRCPFLVQQLRLHRA